MMKEMMHKFGIAFAILLFVTACTDNDQNEDLAEDAQSGNSGEDKPDHSRSSRVEYADIGPISSSKNLGSFTESGAIVTVSKEVNEEGITYLAVEIKPVKAGFHLYSANLDPKDTKGLGRPTLVDFESSENVLISGPQVSSVAEKFETLEGLGISLPIYPEGAIIVRTPIEISNSKESSWVSLAISYMACQTGGQCEVPVDRKMIKVLF